MRQARERRRSSLANADLPGNFALNQVSMAICPPPILPPRPNLADAKEGAPGIHPFGNELLPNVVTEGNHEPHREAHEEERPFLNGTLRTSQTADHPEDGQHAGTRAANKQHCHIVPL